MDQFLLGVILGAVAVLFIFAALRMTRKSALRRMDNSVSLIQPLATHRYWLKHDLTARELEVARLVARGLSNAQVAAQLGLKPRTIDSHLRTIYQKLNVNSRTELANVIRDIAD